MPSGDDDETVPRCTGLASFGERFAGDFRAGARLAGELLTGELLAGALLVRDVLFRAFWAACVFLECRTFTRLKLSTVIDGTRAEPVRFGRPSPCIWDLPCERTCSAAWIDSIPLRSRHAWFDGIRTTRISGAS
ncbi:hypothetical protein RAD16_23295 [Bradyrhizobium sp. 18BD]